jgi:hypothetical protein
MIQLPLHYVLHGQADRSVMICLGFVLLLTINQELTMNDLIEA